MHPVLAKCRRPNPSPLPSPSPSPPPSPQTVEKIDKSDIQGLVTASEWKARMDQKNKRKDSIEAADEEAEKLRLEKEERLRKRKKKKKTTMALSFNTDGDDDDGVDSKKASAGAPKKKSKKNPTVETSFLPDKDRELVRKKEERRLKQEWLDMQEKVKQEKVRERDRERETAGLPTSCTSGA